MRKPRAYLILFGLLLAGGVLGLFFIGDREPEYEGKKLSEWVTNFATLYFPGDSKFQEAEEAVRHIGPRATPYLVRWLCWEPSRWRNKMPSALAHILQKLAPYSFGSDDTKRLLATGSVKAIGMLGPLPHGAVAELNIQMQTPRQGEGPNRAGIALASLGTQGIPSLTAALKNQSSVVRVRSAELFARTGTNAFPAVPVLIGCLKDADCDVAYLAARCLGKLRLRSDLVAPALAQCVLDVSARSDTRLAAVWGLENFGQEAVPAIGILRNALVDPDEWIRRAVTNALQKLDPKSLKGTDR